MLLLYIIDARLLISMACMLLEAPVLQQVADLDLHLMTGSSEGKRSTQKMNTHPTSLRKGRNLGLFLFDLCLRACLIDRG